MGLMQAVKQQLVCDCPDMRLDISSGRKGLLGRKAGKVFVHVKDIIKQATLASSVGQEYSTLLRTSLLPVQQYCNAVACETFKGIHSIAHVMTYFEQT